jgi:hypothetical protein
LLFLFLAVASASAYALTHRRPADAPAGATGLSQVEFDERQRRCMEHRLPADHLVYVSDPDEAARVLATREGYAPPRSAVAAARPGPPPAGAGYYSDVLRGVMFLDNAPDQPLAFVHRRTTPAGEAWLVTLQYDVKLAGAAPFAEARVLRFTALSGRPAAWPNKVYIEVFDDEDEDVVHYELPIPDRAPLRLYAGQADDADPAHFTLRYALGGDGGTIDAWLRDRGAVEMKVRDGPAVSLLRPVTLRAAARELLGDSQVGKM